MAKVMLPVYLTKEQREAVREEAKKVGMTSSGLVAQMVQKIVEKSKRG